MTDTASLSEPNAPAFVLIVEDSRTQAAMLRSLLEKHGYQVEIASDGSKALDCARNRKPALVISDIVMPMMDGFEMCAALKAEVSLADVPVLLLTTLGDPIDIVRGLQAGADYYVTKPYDPDYLQNTVAQIVGQQSAGIFKQHDPREELEFDLSGQHHRVSAGRRQMLNLLLSTYTNAVLQNRVLMQTQHELRTVNSQLVAQREQIEAQQRELREINTLLHQQATRDGLTGLRNRRALMERLDEEIERTRRHATPFSLMMIDVDKFKQFNDSFGHPAGDQVLCQVARLMEEQARGTDFVARYGGEEFVILLANTEEETARVAAERVRVAIETASWPLRAVTASIGIATIPYAPDADKTAYDETMFLSRADTALYASKTAGRNRVTHANDLS
ncbi:MAG TPA: diguanylate cyclase [Abditibacteriaceae bacterium]